MTVPPPLKSELLRGEFHFLSKSGFLEIKFYLKPVHTNFLAKRGRRICVGACMELLEENLRGAYARGSWLALRHEKFIAKVVVRVKLRVVRVVLIGFPGSITRGGGVLGVELGHSVAGGAYMIKGFRPRRSIEIGPLDFVPGSASNYSGIDNLFDLIVLVDIGIYRRVRYRGRWLLSGHRVGGR